MILLSLKLAVIICLNMQIDPSRSEQTDRMSLSEPLKMRSYFRIVSVLQPQFESCM